MGSMEALDNASKLIKENLDDTNKLLFSDPNGDKSLFRSAVDWLKSKIGNRAWLLRYNNILFFGIKMYLILSL